MTKRKLTFINDPGHGWLSVSQKDLVVLGIEDKVSSYSYIDATRAYLEEDCDAYVYIDAAKAAGWEIEIKHSCRKSFNRALASYDSRWVKDPIKVGRVVADHQGRTYTVTGKQGSRWILDNRYSVSGTNPYSRITP